MTYGHSLRRFTEHRPAGDPYVLDATHQAVTSAHTLFEARIEDAAGVAPLLKEGKNNRKIGDRVVKGKWRGMPIFTLTLEERATCYSRCRHWRDCYGNKMNWSVRLKGGEALERGLEHELEVLQRDHPAGFVVRLHVLGDFYSTEYVCAWMRWLDRFPALHVFGYSSWPPETEIGALLRTASKTRWDRFAIRCSNQNLEERAAETIDDAAKAVNAIVCPAQTDRTECCATCGLCWGTTRNIAFLRH